MYKFSKFKKFFWGLLFCSLLVSPSFLNQNSKENYKIDKSISLSENAEINFKKNHMINFNKLNELYNNINQQNLNTNKEVHIALMKHIIF
jgi:hypothetical protein